MAIYTTERVLEVHHWSEQLFSFTTTRCAGLRFENGQFIMVGLELEGGKKITRAYSIASANHEEHLEFYSIKVPNGPLTARLALIEPGAPVLLSTKPTGTLVTRDLTPGKRLFMLATGTGVAPFLGIVKDPQTYEQFEEIIPDSLRRENRRLGVRGFGVAAAASRPLSRRPGERAIGDYPTVTREPSGIAAASRR